MKLITGLQSFVTSAILCLLLSPLPVFAHDYWFEPDNFFPMANNSVTLRMQLGTNLVIEEERPYQLNRTVSFKLFSAKSIFDLRDGSADGAVPVAKFSVGSPGTYLVGMERNPVTNILEAEKFREYLAEEGLTKIIEERKRRGESSKFGYERYSRYIKSLLQVGGRNDSTYKRSLGFKLEIIPLENPYTKTSGKSLKVKILFDGKALADTSVAAYNRSDGKVTIQKMQTDRNGIVKVRLENSGFWLVRLVKMERCRRDCEEIDWESYWASLSFAIR